MIGRGPFLLAVTLAACAAPEVAQDIGEGRKLLTDIQADVGPAVTRAADTDFRAAEDRMIADGEDVVEVVGECDPFGEVPAATVESDCRLRSLVPMPDDTSARSVKEFLFVLDTYIAALEALASSKSVDEARKQADALVAAFGTPSPDRLAAFEALAVKVRERKTLIVEATGFLLDQVRIIGLRRVIRLAAPEIDTGIAAAAAYLEELDPRLEEAQEARLNALDELLVARDSGNSRRYRAAVDTLRKAHAEFVAAQAASPAVRLRAFGVVHDRLERAARNPGTLARIVGLLETLRKLRDSAQ